MIKPFLKKCSYDLSGFNEKIYMIKRNNISYIIEDYTIKNVNITENLNNLAYDIQNLDLNLVQSYNGNKYEFTNDITFSISNSYNFQTVLDIIYDNSYIFILKDKNNNYYMVNEEFFPEIIWEIKYQNNQLYLSISMTIFSNHPMYLINDLDLTKFNELNVCNYDYVTAKEMYAIPTNKCSIVYDENLNIVKNIIIDNAYDLKKIDINLQTLEFTSTINENKNEETNLYFNFPLNQNYNWKDFLIEFFDNKYTFIITMSQDKNCIIENMFANYEINNDVKINLNSISSVKNFYLVTDKNLKNKIIFKN